MNSRDDNLNELPNPLIPLVQMKGFEPSTSALRSPRFEAPQKSH